MTDILFINTLLWIPVCSLLVYLIPLCILDIAYREVNNGYWIPLALVNLPVLGYLYYTGWYPWYCFLISIVTTGIFASMVYVDLLNGADFLFLLFISLFWIVNPYPLPHGIQLQFYIYLIVSLGLTSIILPIANYLKGIRTGSLLELMSTYPRGVPLMLPISLAFCISVVVG